LEHSRAEWRVAEAAYADSRREQKRLGRRVPASDDPPPSRTGHWYAAAPVLSRRAAAHALKLRERVAQPALLGSSPTSSSTST
jgi:hypothetical protein